MWMILMPKVMCWCYAVQAAIRYLDINDKAFNSRWRLRNLEYESYGDNTFLSIPVDSELKDMDKRLWYIIFKSLQFVCIKCWSHYSFIHQHQYNLCATNTLKTTQWFYICFFLNFIDWVSWIRTYSIWYRISVVKKKIYTKIEPKRKLAQDTCFFIESKI